MHPSRAFRTKPKKTKEASVSPNADDAVTIAPVGVIAERLFNMLIGNREANTLRPPLVVQRQTVATGLGVPTETTAFNDSVVTTVSGFGTTRRKQDAVVGYQDVLRFRGEEASQKDLERETVRQQTMQKHGLKVYTELDRMAGFMKYDHILANKHSHNAVALPDDSATVVLRDLQRLYPTIKNMVDTAVLNARLQQSSGQQMLFLAVGNPILQSSDTIPIMMRLLRGILIKDHGVEESLAAASAWFQCSMPAVETLRAAGPELLTALNKTQVVNPAGSKLLIIRAESVPQLLAGLDDNKWLPVVFDLTDGPVLHSHSQLYATMTKTKKQFCEELAKSDKLERQLIPISDRRKKTAEFDLAACEALYDELQEKDQDEAEVMKFLLSTTKTVIPMPNYQLLLVAHPLSLSARLPSSFATGEWTTWQKEVARGTALMDHIVELLLNPSAINTK